MDRQRLRGFGLSVVALCGFAAGGYAAPVVTDSGQGPVQKLSVHRSGEKLERSASTRRPLRLVVSASSPMWCHRVGDLEDENGGARQKSDAKTC